MNDSVGRTKNRLLLEADVASLGDPAVFAILVVLAFLPPVLFLFWIRAHERHDREPVRTVLGAFAYGGSLGVAVAVVLHVLFEFGYTQGGAPFRLEDAFLAAVVIAPIVEEFAKALGLGTVRRHINELEDGIIYGAALGLGFAATENLVYGLTTLTDSGFEVAITVVVVRVFSSTLLHASASAIIGFGYGRAVLAGQSATQAAPHYLLAVLLHAGYNYLAGTQILMGFGIAVVIVIVVFGSMRRRIRRLDAYTPDGWRRV